MTWKELKEHIEREGVTDDLEVGNIEVIGSFPIRCIAIGIQYGYFIITTEVDDERT